MTIEKEKPRMTEKEYRLTERVSYSSLKLLSNSKSKFYKKFIAKELITEEEPSIALLLGSLVDCLLFSKEEFDNRFAVASTLKPIGQVGEFTDSLLTKTFRCLDCNGELTQEFMTLFNETLEYRKLQGDFKGKTVEKVLELFTTADKNGTVAETYYKEGRKNYGKQLVDLNLIASAERIVEKLKNSQFTRDIINMESDEDIDVYYQFPILFSKNGVELKSLVDLLVVDRGKGIIRPYDLKVSYQVEDFPYNFLKNQYYLQLGVYDLGIQSWMKEQGLESYELKRMTFIVADSTGTVDPLLYECSGALLDQSLEGFTTPSGRYYEGVIELLGELQWSLANNTWNTSQKAFINNGRFKLDKF